MTSGSSQRYTDHRIRETTEFMSSYYWCLTHERVEDEASCRARDRLGPYPTPEAARGWRDRVEERDESWDAEDERWHGSDDHDASDT